MKISIKERFIAGLIILTAMLGAAAIGNFYLPAGVAIGTAALAFGGFSFDGLSEEEQVYRTSPWLMPSACLGLVAAIACLNMLVDLFSRIMR